MEESRSSPDQEDDRIIQIRDALMCPNDNNKFECLRTARFLNYTTSSIHDDVFELPLDAFAYNPVQSVNKSIESVNKITEPVKNKYSGWGSPSLNWIEWVNAMADSHASTWKRSGVYDSILSSRYTIKKHEGLMSCLVDKWCVETNTFVFPWGEATVTLEDTFVLGGFSLIGNNVLGPVKREAMKVVEEKMRTRKKETVGMWMKEMMNSGSEIEHEAFLVTWLCKFVFPSELLRENLFPAAVMLANGVKLALGPAVLAGVYRDLGLLKETGKETVVKSPLQFVQVWAMERFMELKVVPVGLKVGEPRIARWHQVVIQNDVRAVLDNGKEGFDYRPYTKVLSNFKFPKFYLEDDCWVSVGNDESIVAFGRCLRFSKLVGLDCVEPYYPHRVGLQFGYDQDVPGVVSARVESPELAWKDYIRPISDDLLYIPARLHEADVTVGYIRWWKNSVAVLQAEAKRISNKLAVAVSSPKQKSVTTTTKVTLGGTSVTGSSKQPLKKPEWVQRPTPAFLKKPEWVQKSSQASTKSPESSSGRVADNVSDLKGALKGSGGTKAQGHVTFQLPGSSPQRSVSNTSTLSPDKTDSLVKKPRMSVASSPVKRPRMLPRVVGIAKQSSSSSPRVPKQTSSVCSLPPKRDNYLKNQNSPNKASSSLSGTPLKRKNSPRSRQDIQKNSPNPRVSKEPKNKSPLSSSGSPFSWRKKSPKSSEAVNSRSNSSCPRVASEELNNSPSSSSSPSLTRKKSPRSLDTINSISPRETQLDNRVANMKSLLEDVVTLQHVDEEGEVTYQIPKQQFENLSQGVQDVLHDLQSIKFALNIQDGDDE